MNLRWLRRKTGRKIEHDWFDAWGKAQHELIDEYETVLQAWRITNIEGHDGWHDVPTVEEP